MFKFKDALEAIKDKPEFSVKYKDGYTVIDYNLKTPDTFTGATEEQTKILHNLRGTAFDMDGNISRLCFHSFFNYGEKPENDKKLNFSDDHTIMEKIDGSMLSPIYIDNGYVWGTRAGETDVSKLVDEFLKDHPSKSDYDEFINSCRLTKHTPMFEYCSPENRVVLAYPERKLTLTGIRSMETGEYAKHKLVEYLGSIFKIPVVKKYESIDRHSLNEFIKKISDSTGCEGVVVRFESGANTGHMLKLKSSEYILLHKTISDLRFEKDVMQMIMTGVLDDALSLLDPVRREQIEAYSNGFSLALENTVIDLIAEYDEYKDIESQKEFAEAIKDNKFRSMLFTMRAKQSDPFELVLTYCRKKATNQAGAAEVANFLKFSGEYAKIGL
jgi:RNA ligase